MSCLSHLGMLYVQQNANPRHPCTTNSPTGVLCLSQLFYMLSIYYVPGRNEYRTKTTLNIMIALRRRNILLEFHLLGDSSTEPVVVEAIAALTARTTTTASLNTLLVSMVIFLERRFG